MSGNQATSSQKKVAQKETVDEIILSSQNFYILLAE